MDTVLRATCMAAINTREAMQLLKVSNWKKLTSQQKKMAIAIDIIRMTLIGQIIPTTGHYIDIPVQHIYLEKKDTQVAIQTGKLTCTACALGSAFISMVGKTDGYSAYDLDGGDLFYPITTDEEQGDRSYATARKKLAKLFGHAQLILIESAFEKGTSQSNNLNKAPKNVEEAIEFGRLYNTNSEDRLLSIWLNVYQNQGIFKP